MRAPTRKDAEQSIIDGTQETDADKDSGLDDAEATRVEIDGRKQFFDLRKIWSGWIIFWITALILFNVILTVLVGAGCLSFVQAPWFVTTVTVETFLQVVGLGYVAAKYLFSHG